MKKRILSLIAGAAIALTPLSSFALSPMSDAGMKDATGQAGVSITVDNVVIEQNIGATTYTDMDGTDNTAGSIVISSKHLIKKFNALTSGTELSAADKYYGDTTYQLGTGTTTVAADADTDSDGNPIVVQAGSGTWDKASALSIDVGKCDTLSAISVNNAANGGEMESGTYVGVVIGLPTLEITTSTDSYTVGVAMEGAINTGDEFISITKEASTMAILSGTVEIAAH